MILRILNPASRVARWSRKSAVFLAMYFLVLFPDPRLAVRHVQHWIRLDSLPDEGSPLLSPLVAEVRSRLSEPGGGTFAALGGWGVDGGGGEPTAGMESADRLAPLPTPPLPTLHLPTTRPIAESMTGSGCGAVDPAHALAVVERVVYERIPYAWDWDVWGVVDYLPTVHETLTAGREDCDGRAVVAAAILRELGITARLVSDGSHLWVWTPAGQTMSPMPTSSGKNLLAPSADGTGSEINVMQLAERSALLVDWPTNLAYGTAVFPPERQGVLLLTFWLMLLSVRPRWGVALVGLVLLAAAWQWARVSSADPWERNVEGAWIWLVGSFAGAFVTLRSRDGRVGKEERIVGRSVPAAREYA